MKLKSLSLCLVGALVVGCIHPSFAETTWYLLSTGSSKYNTHCEADLAYWGTNADDASTAGSGAPTANDVQIVTKGRRLRLGTANFTTTAKSLTIGDASTTGDIIHDSGVGTYGNDGIFLKNGRYEFNYKKNLKTAGKMTVLSTADKPVIIHCQQLQYGGYTHTIGGPFIGASDACVLIGCDRSNVGNTPGPTNTTFVITDPSQYKGTIRINAQFPLDVKQKGDVGTRVKLGTMATDGDITLLTEGCALSTYRATDTVTAANVTIAAGDRLEVVGEGASVGLIKATVGLTVAKGTEVQVMAAPSVGGDYTILEGPASSTFTADDFTLVGDLAELVEASLVVESDATSRRLVLKLAYGYVEQIKNDGLGKDLDNQNHHFAATNAAYWSDGKAPHAGAVYVLMENAGCCTPYDSLVYEFPGEKLIFRQNSRIVFFGKGMKCKKMIVPAGVTADYWSGQTAYHAIDSLTAESIQVDGLLRLGAYNNTKIKVDGPVTGSGEVLIWGVDSTSAGAGTYYAGEGAFANFKGRIRVSINSGLSGKTNATQLYYVLGDADCGCALDAFDYKALAIENALGSTAQICSARETNPGHTFTNRVAANRGLLVSGKGTIDVQWAAGTFELPSSITLNGTLKKTASGRISVGGPMKFLSSAGTLVDTPTAGKNVIDLCGGRFEARHCDAFNGAEIHLNKSAMTNGWLYIQLAVDYANADLVKYGVRNTKTDTPFVIDEGCQLTTVPFQAEWPTEPPTKDAEFTQALVTVSATAAANLAALLPDIIPAKRVYKAFNQTPYQTVNADGSVTMGLRFTPKKFAVILR